ncbi:MAG TPA: Hsp20/alpha crystallin family protein [Nitrospirales bacterium]
MTFNLSYAPFDVDKFLDDALQATNNHKLWNPPCNTYEDEQGFWVQAAVPGLDRKDINIVFEDGVLTVKGEAKEDEKPLNRTYFAREIGWGDFSRSFRLPNNVDPTKVSASYKEGLLTVQIPKREEAKPRQIVVE